MSYAEVAAKGPKQTDEEKMPAQVPEILHSDSSVHTLDSLSSSGPNSVPSYADQQLASERAQQARREGEEAADEMAEQARDFERRAEAELARLESEAGTSFEKFSAEAKHQYGEWKAAAAREYKALKEHAGQDGAKAKASARDAERWAEKNKSNPVVIGNAVVVAALGGLLGIGAYRMHQQGTLTAKVVGLWAGAVGLFAVGDYYVSQFFFKKYPPKQ